MHSHGDYLVEEKEHGGRSRGANTRWILLLSRCEERVGCGVLGAREAAALEDDGEARRGRRSLVSRESQARQVVCSWWESSPIGMFRGCSTRS